MKTIRRAGFTTVEVMIAVTIMVIVFASVAVVQGRSLDLMASTSTSGYLEEKAGRAVDALSLELCWAESDAVLITAQNGASRIDLSTPVDYAGGVPVWSTPITYRVEPSLVDANQNDLPDDFQLVRIQDGETRVLCHYVEPAGFDLTRVDDNIQVQLRLSKAGNTSRQVLTANAQTSISLRN